MTTQYKFSAVQTVSLRYTGTGTGGNSTTAAIMMVHGFRRPEVIDALDHSQPH